MMPVARFLKASQVRLGLAHGHLDGIDPERDRVGELARLKDEVIEELVDVFMEAGTGADIAVARSNINNRTKFAIDFRNRERKGTTALAGGVAVPHVRSRQARQFTFILARSRDGVWFDAPDGEPTHLFLGVAGPQRDADDWYLRFYQWIGYTFKTHGDWLRPALLEAETADDMVALLVGLD